MTTDEAIDAIAKAMDERGEVSPPTEAIKVLLKDFFGGIEKINGSFERIASAIEKMAAK